MLIRSLCLALCLVADGVLAGFPGTPSRSAPQACFVLYDEQSGAITREPAAACATRATPASTFKIPHALAALDAGVVAGAHETLRYDGSPYQRERWRHDHDLASAMRDSAVWYFQRLAERLGAERERAYLKAFHYGNQDATGPLTSFWLGDSLQISPDEQLVFLRRFFAGQLNVSEHAARTVREILVQPQGQIVNATGAHAFGPSWPPGTTISAKTGAAADQGRQAVWLVGRVTRGDRAWIFVSCVLGSDDATAAIDLAAARLAQLRVLSPLR